MQQRLLGLRQRWLFGLCKCRHLCLHLWLLSCLLLERLVGQGQMLLKRVLLLKRLRWWLLLLLVLPTAGLKCRPCTTLLLCSRKTLGGS